MNIVNVLALLISAVNGFQDSEPICGYNSCHTVNPNLLNVHLVPHSYENVGYSKTTDQYYYNNVQYIISSVVKALLKNSDRRFIQVETVFLYKWWNLQSNSTKSKIRQLINEGRLEIANGAWTVNDEATTHYQSTIDQYTLGLRFLEDNFGTCARPRVSWQIGTFGHSREQASLLSQFGMDGVFFARFDFRDREKRLKERNMDMLWTGSANLGNDSNIFASALYNHYSWPNSFCFDITCRDSLIVTDRDTTENNWWSRVMDFANVITEQSQCYLTNNILIPMGDDFHWQAAEINYHNIDMLIEGFKIFKPTIDGKEINIFYSTPSCYTKAVNDYVKANNRTLNVKTDDFLPHADHRNKLWTGFFTSRPTSKRLERFGNNLLQITKQITALGGKSYYDNYPLSQAMGVIQHHNIISGVENYTVEKDLHRYLVKEMRNAITNASSSFSSILGLNNDLNLKSCLLSNISICDESNKEKFTVLIYNPLARTVSHYIQIPVRNGTWKVTGPTGENVPHSLTEPIRHFDYIPGETVLPQIALFRAANLKPLGYKIYKFELVGNFSKDNAEKVKIDEGDRIGFSDKYITFDAVTDILKSITLNNVTLDVSQKMMYYTSSTDRSDAYVFRPHNIHRDAIEFGRVENKILTNEGDVVREIRQTWNDWVTQIIRIYQDEDYIEFDWLVGPLNLSIADGLEVITRYTTKLENSGDEFYTDSNGREMIYRKKNFRPTYEYTNDEPQSGNYYPVNTKILVKNDSIEFAVLPDRSEGGTSLKSGEVELMLNRAVKGKFNEMEYDQPLVARGTHYVTFGVSSEGNGGRTMAAVERDIAQRKLLQPWVFFTSEDLPVKEDSFLNGELPANIHLLTLESWNISENSILIRLEHILEKDEDPELSKEVTIDISDLFKVFTIKSMKEYTLAANTPIEENSRLIWPQIRGESSSANKNRQLRRDDTDLKITLGPMEIRTFIATIEYSTN